MEVFEYTRKGAQFKFQSDSINTVQRRRQAPVDPSLNSNLILLIQRK